MSLQPRRPLNLSFRVRRNFKTRDWTSIGLRGTRASSRKAAKRPIAPLAASNPSSKHGGESRSVGFDAPDSSPPLTTGAPTEKDWSEWLWLGLVMLALAAAATVQLMA
jgi:hypothetical protein